MYSALGLSTFQPLLKCSSAFMQSTRSVSSQNCPVPKKHDMPNSPQSSSGTRFLKPTDMLPRTVFPASTPQRSDEQQILNSILLSCRRPNHQ
jgi:hypothetical protein